MSYLAYTIINTILLMSTDTLPTLLDDIHESKECTKKSVLRAQDIALESDVPQEEEESGSEPQLKQKCMCKLN